MLLRGFFVAGRRVVNPWRPGEGQGMTLEGYPVFLLGAHWNASG